MRVNTLTFKLNSTIYGIKKSIDIIDEGRFESICRYAIVLIREEL